MDAVGQSFESDVLAASHEVPVLADFWAEWCGPCRALGPILEKLESGAGGTWRLVKVNVDEHQDIARQYRIQGIPACKLFHNGEVIGEFTGALPEPQIRSFLDEHLPSEEKALVDRAKTQVLEGDTEGAKATLEDVLGRDPGNREASVALARLVFSDDPTRAEALVSEVGPGDAAGEEAEAVRTLAGRVATTDAKDAHPGWAGYLKGNEALAKGDYEGALQAWIDILATGHRDIDDDGPRRACIALFKLLGEEHPLTQKYRRAFSSALF